MCSEAYDLCKVRTYYLLNQLAQLVPVEDGIDQMVGKSSLSFQAQITHHLFFSQLPPLSFGQIGKVFQPHIGKMDIVLESCLLAGCWFFQNINASRQ